MKAKNILYVEDDVVTSTAYKNLLEQAGFQVETAYDGIQALTSLRQREPDLILLDLILPKLDGEEVLKFIYGAPHLCQIPIIILSTNTTVALENEALVEKAEDHLLKQDCSSRTLLETIDRVLKVAEAAKKTPATKHKNKVHACAMESPRILSFLQLNLRGAGPIGPAGHSHDLPATSA